VLTDFLREGVMNKATWMVAVTAVSLLAGCEATDDGRYGSRTSQSSNDRAGVFGGLLGGSSSSLERSDGRRARDSEMDRIEAEQRRLDDERAAVERRYGRGRY
jgi:hypothetical protein